MAAPSKNLTEARYKLARAIKCFNDAYEGQPFSLAGERTRELLGESRVWLEEYTEEVTSSERAASD